MLDRRQRYLLRAEAAEQLQNGGMLAEVVVAERWEDARTMRDHVEGLACLLDDLGWSQESREEEFRLTLPVGGLVVVVNRMQVATARKRIRRSGCCCRARSSASRRRAARRR